MNLTILARSRLTAEAAEAAPAVIAAVICFASYIGLPNVLVRKDRPGKSARFRGA